MGAVCGGKFYPEKHPLQNRLSEKEKLCCKRVNIQYDQEKRHVEIDAAFFFFIIILRIHFTVIMIFFYFMLNLEFCGSFGKGTFINSTMLGRENLIIKREIFLSFSLDLHKKIFFCWTSDTSNLPKRKPNQETH